MRAYLIALAILLAVFTTARGQELADASSRIPLKTLLSFWQEENDFQFSGRDELLQGCLVDAGLSDPAQLNDIIKPCRLKVEVKNGVHIISKRPANYLITGKVADAETGLPIPNVSVQMGESGTLTNEYGQFMISAKDEAVQVNVSHVSYGAHVLKIENGAENVIEMKPQNVKLNEVVVGGSYDERLTEDDQRLALLLGDGIPVDAKFFRSLEQTIASEYDTVMNTVLTAKKKRFGIYYHRLGVNRKQSKELGKVYGFSDGENVYINPKTPRLRKRTNFYLSEEIDRYLHYKVVQTMYFQTPGGPPVVVEFPAEKLLDTETGKSKTLTRGRLRRIIEEDEELLAAFNEEKKKSKKLKLYLEAFYERKQQ